MGIRFEDKSGQPRTEQELEYALRIVEERMVQIGDVPDPELYVEFSVIRDALKELLGFRELVQRLKREKGLG